MNVVDKLIYYLLCQVPPTESTKKYYNQHRKPGPVTVAATIIFSFADILLLSGKLLGIDRRSYTQEHFLPLLALFLILFFASFFYIHLNNRGEKVLARVFAEHGPPTRQDVLIGLAISIAPIILFAYLL